MKIRCHYAVCHYQNFISPYVSHEITNLSDRLTLIVSFAETSGIFSISSLKAVTDCRLSKYVCLSNVVLFKITRSEYYLASLRIVSTIRPLFRLTEGIGLMILMLALRSGSSFNRKLKLFDLMDRSDTVSSSNILISSNTTLNLWKDGSGDIDNM